MSTHYEKIVEIKRKFGIKSDTEFCKRAGISRSTVSELKSGRTDTLSTDTIIKICNTFFIPFEVFAYDSAEIKTDNIKKTPSTEMLDDVTYQILQRISLLTDAGKSRALGYLDSLLASQETKDDSRE